MSKRYQFDTEDDIPAIYEHLFGLIRTDPNCPLLNYLKMLVRLPDGYKHIIALVVAVLKANFAELSILAKAMDFETLLRDHLTYFLDQCEQFIWKFPAAWTYVLESLPTLERILEYRSSEGNNYMHLILHHCGHDTAHYILTHFNKLFDQATVKPEELKRRYEIILAKDKDGMSVLDYSVLKRIPELPAYIEILHKSIYHGETIAFPTVLRIDCTDVLKKPEVIEREQTTLKYIDEVFTKSSKACSGTDRSPYYKVLDDAGLRASWDEVTQHYKTHAKTLKSDEFYRLFKDTKLSAYTYVRSVEQLAEATEYLTKQHLVTVDVEYVPVHVDEPVDDGLGPAIVVAEVNQAIPPEEATISEKTGPELVVKATESNPAQIVSALKQLERRVFTVASLQLATPERRYFFDCIELELKGAQYIAQIFENEKILKIFHGGDNDLEAIYRAFGVLTKNIYDTSRASTVLKEFTNMPGLNTLSSQYFSAKLDKSFQKAVWRVRPLPQPMIEYAMTDAVSLMPIFFHQICRITQAQAEEVWQISNQLGKYVELRDKQLSFVKACPAAKNDVF